MEKDEEVAIAADDTATTELLESRYRQDVANSELVSPPFEGVSPEESRPHCFDHYERKCEESAVCVSILAAEHRIGTFHTDHMHVQIGGLDGPHRH